MNQNFIISGNKCNYYKILSIDIKIKRQSTLQHPPKSFKNVPENSKNFLDVKAKMSLIVLYKLELDKKGLLYIL